MDCSEVLNTIISLSLWGLYLQDRSVARGSAGSERTSGCQASATALNPLLRTLRDTVDVRLGAGTHLPSGVHPSYYFLVLVNSEGHRTSGTMLKNHFLGMHRI